MAGQLRVPAMLEVYCYSPPVAGSSTSTAFEAPHYFTSAVVRGGASPSSVTCDYSLERSRAVLCVVSGLEARAVPAGGLLSGSEAVAQQQQGRRQAVEAPEVVDAIGAASVVYCLQDVAVEPLPWSQGQGLGQGQWQGLLKLRVGSGLAATSLSTMQQVARHTTLAAGKSCMHDTAPHNS